MSEQSNNAPPINLEAAIEALLFVSPGTVTVSQLAEALERKPEEIDAALQNLAGMYDQGRGIRLQSFGGRYQLTTTAELAPVIQKFLGLEATARLSRAALEVLAIIAYRQPITRPGIDAIRGVNSDGVLKNLLSKGLVQEVGRTESPGRPILYGVTSEFLQHFGISSLADLPAYDEDDAGQDPQNGENGVLKD